MEHALYFRVPSGKMTFMRHDTGAFQERLGHMSIIAHPIRHLERSMPRCLFAAILVLGTLIGLYTPSPWAQDDTTYGIHIFFSGGCADCWPYTEDTLIPALQAAGVDAHPVIHDFTQPGGRQLLADKAAEFGLPRRIADSLYGFVHLPATDLVVLGHVPQGLLDALLIRDDLPPKLVIQQPKMHGEPKEYRLWAFVGEVQTFPIDTPMGEALSRIPKPGPGKTLVRHLERRGNLAALLPAVVVTGLLDSVNPCALAVILLLLAFLFSIRKSRGQIIQLGSVYISMIFLVYFAIGLGLLRAVRLSDQPHLVARVGSGLLIALGVIHLLEYFWPEFPIKLHMPALAHNKANELLKMATVPATMIMGFIVGLCTFPCSGGIYVSILTLLNAKTTLGWGIGYLALYNVLFVMPLVVLLLVAGNRTTARAWAGWEREHALRIRLWYGIGMIVLGVVLLIWVIG